MVRRPLLAGVVSLLFCGWIVFSSVSQAQTVTLEPVGSIPGPADVVRVLGGYAYIAAGRTLTIHDVSDPTTPEIRGSYTFPEEIWGFRIQGARVYVGANFFGLGILDVSDAESPTLVSSFETGGQTKNGAAFGNRVAIIDHMEGLVLVDFDPSNPSRPLAVSSFFVDGYARDVVTAGSIAYVVDSPSGLYLFDLAKPGPPEPVGILQSPNSPHWIEVSSPEPGGTLLVCGAGAGDLQIYDVSDPSMPVHASTFVTPGRAHRVALEDGLAFVADGSAGIQVVDLADPTRPALLGSHLTPRPARGIAVAGSLVFVVMGESEREGEDREVVILRVVRSR